MPPAYLAEPKHTSSLETLGRSAKGGYQGPSPHKSFNDGLLSTMRNQIRMAVLVVTTGMACSYGNAPRPRPLEEIAFESFKPLVRDGEVDVIRVREDTQVILRNGRRLRVIGGPSDLKGYIYANAPNADHIKTRWVDFRNPNE